MKLYLIERTDDVGWDEHIAVVVRAASKADALAIATAPVRYSAPASGYEGFSGDGSNLTVTRLHAEGERGEILSSFLRG